MLFVGVVVCTGVLLLCRFQYSRSGEILSATAQGPLLAYLLSIGTGDNGPSEPSLPWMGTLVWAKSGDSAGKEVGCLV
jgi:hypothetical protein